MKTYSANKSFILAYQIDEKQLLKLEKLIDEINENNSKKNISYTVNLKNGEELMGLDLEELLDLDNIDDSTIVGLEVRTSILEDNTLSIYFTSDVVFSNIRYHLETNNRKDLIYFRNKINNYIKNLKVMYSIVAVSTFWTYIFLFIPLVTMLTMFIFNFFPMSYINELNNLTIYIILLMTGGIGFLINKLKTIVFPVAEYKIGYGIKRSQRNYWIRNSIILTIISGFVMSIIL